MLSDSLARRVIVGALVCVLAGAIYPFQPLAEPIANCTNSTACETGRPDLVAFHMTLPARSTASEGVGSSGLLIVASLHTGTVPIRRIASCGRDLSVFAVPTVGAFSVWHKHRMTIVAEIPATVNAWSSQCTNV